MTKDKRMSSRYLLRRFFPYFKKYRHYLAFDLFCASLTTVCELVLPLIVREITNKGFEDISLITTSLIMKVVIFYVILRLIDAAAMFYMNSLGHIMGAKIETDMRNDLFSHLQELSYSFYDNTKIGHLMSRITNDLFDVTEFAHHFPEEMFIAIIKVIVGFYLFADMNIWLALIVFMVLPLMLIVTKKTRQKMRQAFSESRFQIGEINAQTEDSLLGIRVVKSFANENIERQKFGKGSGKFLNIKRKSYYYMATFHSTIRLFDGLVYIIVLAVGAYLLSKGKTSVGDFSASLLIVTTLLATIRRIVEFSEQYNRGMTGIERFVEVMDELIDVKDSENASELKEVKGEIEFKNVTFCYSGSDKCVLENLDLHIKPGENIAIVGPSGGGKTTLCNLIPRFYDVTEGEILLDGKNIKDIQLQSLRSNIGVVQQDVYLFSGSVKENIAYGKPEAKEEDIINAAKKAGAHDFISELPEGYDTFVGERGVKLSGGQKQRIAIARVFLKNPPILILDEATSALDNESEMLVQKSLERLAEGRTTLTIAHRLTTIRNASEILVLTEEGIAEQGTHKDLISQDGIYKDLYALYTDLS